MLWAPFPSPTVPPLSQRTSWLCVCVCVCVCVCWQGVDCADTTRWLPQLFHAVGGVWQQG